MSKTLIDSQKVFEVLRSEDVPFEALKSWNKVDIAGHRVYIPMGKRIGRIDISAFEVPHAVAHVTDLGERSFGNVRQQLDFGRPEAEVLESLRMVLRYARTLAPLDKVPNRAKPKEEASRQMELPLRAQGGADGATVRGEGAAAGAATGEQGDADQGRRERVEALKRRVEALQRERPGMTLGEACRQAQAEAQ